MSYKSVTFAIAAALISALSPAIADSAYEAFDAAHGRGDHETAAHILFPLADGGDAKAQFALCELYLAGQGVPRDAIKAALWCGKAADQGHALARLALGIMHLQGMGGFPADTAEALRLLKPVAEQGLAEAQVQIGSIYEKGLGVAKDDQLAFKWYKMASDQNDNRAQYVLGKFYKDGRGVKQDYRRAVRLFQLSADQGTVIALAQLGTLYFNGQGVPQDYAQALKYFEEAASKGDTFSTFSIGWMHLIGAGVPRDDAQAFRWLKVAAERGYGEAQQLLGLMYTDGTMPQDIVRAHMWFNLASAAGQVDAPGYRDRLAKKMSADQIAEAQKMARQWKPLAPSQAIAK